MPVRRWLLGGVFLLLIITGFTVAQAQARGAGQGSAPTHAASGREPDFLPLETEWRHVPVRDHEAAGDAGAPVPSQRIRPFWMAADPWLGLGALGTVLLLLFLPARAAPGRAGRAAAGPWPAGVAAAGPSPAGWGAGRAGAGARVAAFLRRAWAAALDAVVSAGEWAWYEGVPSLLHGVGVVGLYLLGLVFECVNSLAFGAVGWGMARLGRSPDSVPYPAFHAGRMAGAKAVEYWGYLEMLLGVTGQGGGMLLSVTGVGAVAGAPAAAASAGVALAGMGHVGRGRVAYEQARQAFERTGGSLWGEPPAGGLSEEEVRRLLGPKASPQAVERFMQFQAYAARKLGANLSAARVRQFRDRGLGAVLARWVEELGPERAAALLEHYGGNRRLLAGITEHRALRRIAAEGHVVLKFNADVGQAGADIIYLNLETGKVTLVDAKGSLAGSYVRGPRTFTEHLQGNIDLIRRELDEQVKRGVMTPTQAEEILGTLKDTYEIEIVLGGTAQMTEAARTRLALDLHIPTERVRLVLLDP